MWHGGTLRQQAWASEAQVQRCGASMHKRTAIFEGLGGEQAMCRLDVGSFVQADDVEPSAAAWRQNKPAESSPGATWFTSMLNGCDRDSTPCRQLRATGLQPGVEGWLLARRPRPTGAFEDSTAVARARDVGSTTCLHARRDTCTGPTMRMPHCWAVPLKSALSRSRSCGHE